MTITTNNLHLHTEQQVFDYIAHHLLEQQEHSLNADGECVYHSEDGLKCAAGCLIPDEDYCEELEDSHWSFLTAVGRVNEAHAEIIARMQSLHDKSAVRLWGQRLKELAQERGLVYA